MREEVSFYVFEKDDPKLSRKRNVLSYYEEEEAPVEFQQKDHIETLQKMAILLLNTLRDEDFDHELQQMYSFF